jgi:hypothetical protein
VDGERAYRWVLVVPVRDPDTRARPQKLPALEGPAEEPVGGGPEGDREGGRIGSRSGTSSPTERCSQAILDFLSTTDVGRGLVPVPAGEAAQYETSEWQLRGRNEREEERRQEAEKLGAEVEERPLFLPRPPSWPRKRSKEPEDGFLLSFLCNFLGALYLSRDGPGRRAKGSCNGPPAD